MPVSIRASLTASRMARCVKRRSGSTPACGRQAELFGLSSVQRQTPAIYAGSQRVDLKLPIDYFPIDHRRQYFCFLDIIQGAGEYVFIEHR